MSRLVIHGALWMACSWTAFGSPATSTTSSTSSSSRHSEAIMLKVDKLALRAELVTLPEDHSEARTLARFPIAIGREVGDKIREGDNKTPEGIYFTQRHIPDAALPAKYGVGAIPLDYPNAFDRAFRRTGHGIWLHGVDQETRIEKQRVTEGCVAFHNPHIAGLRQWLAPRQAIVVIAKDIAKINLPDEVAAVRDLTRQWLKAWNERDAETYLSFYGSQFRHPKGRTLQQFGTYKRRVFSNYRKMTVDVSNIRVVTHPKYAMTVMNQDFRGDHYHSVGRKILFWTRSEEEGGRWRILREEFTTTPFRKRLIRPEDVILLTSIDTPGTQTEEGIKNL